MNHEIKYNNILDVDSYKSSHWGQYPPGTTGLFAYMESRGGEYPSIVFFGLQYILKRYFCTPITKEMVDEAKAFMEAHGEPFNYDGWMYIVNKLKGRYPLTIRAVPEGTKVPNHNVLLTVECQDPKAFWLVSWLETQIMRLWYPLTVCSQSYYIKQLIREALTVTADDPEGELPFKLHDFGARGVSSAESAGIGGAAHLVNFMGSDTIQGVRYANEYYKHPMAAFSIPASEHSTITAWGRDGEEAAYRNMVTKFGQPGKLVACVSDSYDIWNAVENFWCGSLRKEVEASGATLVIRPDSGVPQEVVLKTLQILESRVGMTKNKKGYKVLPKCFRVIQGDGVNYKSIYDILWTLVNNGYCTSNVAFGMGGKLLQDMSRDTNKFAYKTSLVTIDGEERPICKDPVTDPGKASKAGRLDLVVGQDGKPTTCTVPQHHATPGSLLQTVYQNGQLLVETTLDEVRARTNG